MPMNARIGLSVQADLTSQLDLALGTVPLSFIKDLPLLNGTGLDQADRIWHDNRTLAASASENIDLAGVLTDAFGQTITFARIKGLIVAAAKTNTNNVVVGGHATAAFINWVSDATDKVVVRPGGLLAVIAPDATGYAVTATTADMLQVANSAGSTEVKYDIVLIGASA